MPESSTAFLPSRGPELLHPLVSVFARLAGCNRKADETDSKPERA